jgi:hypothetical protein
LINRQGPAAASDELELFRASLARFLDEVAPHEKVDAWRKAKCVPEEI